jgi:hypothetical protein
MRHLTRRAADGISAGVLELLTDLQHLQPHRALRSCLTGSAARMGIALEEIDRSLAWLSLDGSRSIGRLRRTELMQLAHHIERRRNTGDGSSAPQPPLRAVEGPGRP